MISVPDDVKALSSMVASQGPTLCDVAIQFDRARLRERLPQRDFLLYDARTGRPVLMRGKPALFAGKGGSGKTMVLSQLTICLATGRPWIGVMETRKPRRVLMALGEETADEAHRRFHHCCQAMGLTDAELDAVGENVTVLPLASIGVALTREADDSPGLPETPRAGELRDILLSAVTESRPYDLVVIDPLSRFAGPDVEKDNSAATRFVQVLETLTTPECGGPALVIAHHVRKAGKDDDSESSDLIRGASGLHDGVRGAFILGQNKPLDGAPDLLRLRMVKSNYTAIPEPVALCRPADGHGTLRLATQDEIDAYAIAKGGRGASASVGENLDRLLEIVRAAIEVDPSNPHGLTREEIRERLKVSKASASAAISAAEARGLIKKAGPKRGFILVNEGAQ